MAATSRQQIQHQKVLDLKKVLDVSVAHTSKTLMKTLESLDALGDLPTDLLASTKIGISVNQLVRSVEDQSVRSRAKDLVKKWRHGFRNRGAEVSQAIRASDQKSATRPSQPNSNSSPSSLSSSSKLSSSPASNGTCNKLSPDSKEDHVNQDSKRNGIRERILKALSTEVSPEQLPNLTTLAKAIECELHSQLSRKDYVIQCRSVLFNLNNKDNVQVRSQLISGAIKPSDVPRLTPDEMATEEMASKRVRIRQLAMEEVQSDWDVKHSDISDGLFTCPNCNGKKTTYQQAQIGHGLDEPLTTFVLCYECNNRWKFDDIGASADADG